MKGKEDKIRLRGWRRRRRWWWWWWQHKLICINHLFKLHLFYSHFADSNVHSSGLTCDYCQINRNFQGSQLFGKALMECQQSTWFRSKCNHTVWQRFICFLKAFMVHRITSPTINQIVIEVGDEGEYKNFLSTERRTFPGHIENCLFFYCWFLRTRMMRAIDVFRDFDESHLNFVKHFTFPSFTPEISISFTYLKETVPSE